MILGKFNHGGSFTKKTCAYCKTEFVPHPSTKNQQYCGGQECQKARKRKWHQDKIAKDADYRENQKATQKKWQEKNPGYWRAYRARNPDYVEENRLRQRERNRRKRSAFPGVIAKMDALPAEKSIISGYYQLSRVDQEDIAKVAKMDALIVELRAISTS